MTRSLLFGVFLLSHLFLIAQERSDPWLDQLLRQKASPLLQNVLNHPDSFQYQLIYTQIDRDRNNVPHFKNYYLHVSKDNYFNPASTVKMPLSFLALEKLNKMNVKGVDKETSMLTDSSFDAQTKSWKDTSAANGLPSVAQYIRKIFLVSDNDAYSRLYEFLGQEYINKRLWEMGYKDTRITRRFVRMNAEQNRHTNAIRFTQGDRLLYTQPPAYSKVIFDTSKKLLVGRAYLDRDDKLVNEPMDFTTHN
ncbi:MAG TPA: serine hydrolase, partial [Chitinophagaceae bacterium]